MSQYETKALEDFETLLGYVFENKTHLERALTHGSYKNEMMISVSNNECLEFLGDAVLDLVISEVLMVRFPHTSEGALSQMRAVAVNEKKLADVARDIHVGLYLRL